MKWFQDSLMLCEELQEKDGLDFMNENMDLTPYLNDLNDFIGNDTMYDDMIIDKERFIENLYEDNNLFISKVNDIISNDETGTDNNLTKASPVFQFKDIKVENSEEDIIFKAECSTSSNRNPKVDNDNLVYIPKIKPRKYSFKPEVIFEKYFF